ncbi:transporter [Subsaxibacter sp. CAU 1640]|uniref:transporter n=1 Tax=Subsaxibacter sp. CAU 1640 TaxID=2933271 RepID=UPI002005A486|nr:transporter [Subsaxibacter sp. CAU 1640]MCK7589621.1 transporter [Subsaxibacter sp. CAU 1640]
MKFNNVICSAILGFFSTMMLSQEDNTLGALITDRPDATESPTAMPKGFLQVETGSFYETFEDNSIKTESYTYNTTLLRYGLLKNLELRVGWDFVEGKTKVDGTTLDDVTSGFSPLLLGFKTTIVEEQGCMPEIGFLGHLFLPFTAGTDYKPETTGVDFRFSFAHTLSENSSLSYNLGAAWGDDSSEASYIYTLAYGHSLTEKLGIYGELYGDFPENSKANHLWDAGFTYLVNNNLQLDATVGTSITKGQDLLLSAGLSFRIPSKNN